VPQTCRSSLSLASWKYLPMPSLLRSCPTSNTTIRIPLSLFIRFINFFILRLIRYSSFVTNCVENLKKSSINFSQAGSEEGVRIDKILESTVSFKDIPVMKDLLVIQKKIRSIMEDWLNACRSSLCVPQPNFFILADLHYKHKATRLNKNHSDFQKIVLHRRKSKSAEQLNLKNNSKSFEQNLKKYTSTLKNKSNSSFDSLKVQQRCNSAFYRKFLPCSRPPPLPLFFRPQF